MKKPRHCHPMQAIELTIEQQSSENQSKDKRNAFLKLLVGFTFDFEFQCKRFKEINKIK